MKRRMKDMMDVSDKYAVVTEIFDNINMLDTAGLELGDNSGHSGQGERRERHSLVSLASMTPSLGQERSSVVSAPCDLVSPHPMVTSHSTLKSLSDHLSVLRKTYVR